MQTTSIVELEGTLRKQFDYTKGVLFSTLDKTLQQLHVQRQAYQGGTFVGNHVHKLLQVRSIIFFNLTVMNFLSLLSLTASLHSVMAYVKLLPRIHPSHKLLIRWQAPLPLRLNSSAVATEVITPLLSWLMETLTELVKQNSMQLIYFDY